MTTQPLLNNAFWGATPLFKELPPRDLADLTALTTHQHVSAGRVILRQGDCGGEMYLVAAGKVRVSVAIADDEEISLGELGPGDAFGEIALFDNLPRTATVTALEATELDVLSRDAFSAYVLHRPGVALPLLKALALRLRDSSHFVKEALYTHVGTRLADTLLKLAHAYGKHTREGVQIPQQFTPEELGEIAGVPPRVVAAHLRHWQHDGVIKTQRGQLTLIRPEALGNPH